MGYAELLKDPRWQKRRLEIMERDNWTCQKCEGTESTLTVHHKSYKKKEGEFVHPWEYVGEDLITLCDECHLDEENNLKRMQSSVFFAIRELTDNAKAIAALMATIESLHNGYGGRRLQDMDFMTMFALYDLFMTASAEDTKRGWYVKFREDLMEVVEEAFCDG